MPFGDEALATDTHMHFYAESHPKLAAMSHYLREQLAGCRGGGRHWMLQVCPFLLTNLDKAPPPKLPEHFPGASYAPTLGTASTIEV